MTSALFRDDAYSRTCEARVLEVRGDGVVLDQTVFYPRGGGQPGDSGRLLTASGGGSLRIEDTRKSVDGEILHVYDAAGEAPAPGETVTAEIDWDRRYRHMRMHTCLHLLGAVLPYGVTGGAISEERSRLDFDMEDTVDKEQVTREVNALIAADYPVGTKWITDAELEAQPELIRTMSVKPPKGAGKIRLLEIPDIDLQPCGGTHVRHTAEIGPVCVSKVEKKGRHNRRVYVVFDQSQRNG